MMRFARQKNKSLEAHVDWFDSFDFIVEANETDDGGKNANLTQTPENKLRLP